MIKKILILCLSGNRGGMEIDSISMCRRLSNYAEITLLGVKGSPIEEMARNELRLGAQFKFVGTKINRFFARALIDPRVVLALRSVLKKDLPELIIFFGTSEIKSIRFAVAGLDVNLVLRIGTTLQKRKDSFLQKLFYKRADGFLVISEHVRHNLLDVIPVSNDRPVQLCYPVVDHVKAIRSISLDLTETVNVLYHARFVRGKGQKDAVMAFHKVIACTDTPINLTLVGKMEDAEYVNEIEEYIALNELNSRIIIKGDQIDTSPFLDESHIYLGPTYGEGFSNSFVEALAAGLVCVTYDNTVFPYFRNYGFDFLMSRTGDIEALSIVLFKAISAAKDGSIKVAHNRQLIKQLFSADAEINSIEKIHRIISTSKRDFAGCQ